ncbi:MAG: hypothetical protein K6F73_05255, partial [Lachnospiraceae bacterium]|nr:hypothetical protein [Lachnospiraceae bacterium]
NSIEGTVLAQNEITYHEITLSVEEGQENLGTVMGSGVSMINENREIVADPAPGADFDGWYDKDGNLVSEDPEYRFRVEQDVEYIAKFKERDGITAVVLQDPTYSGFVLKPEVRVYDGVKELTAGADYTVAVKNNTNAYIYTEKDNEFDKKKAPTVTVTGKRNYNGKDEVYFTIQPKSLTDGDITVDPIPVEVSDSKDKKPVPKVKWGKKALRNKKDYTIEYLDEAGNHLDVFRAANTEDGHYTVKITGAGNYQGTIVAEYKLLENAQKPVDKLKVTVKNKKYDNGRAVTLDWAAKEIEVKDGSKVLEKGKDFDFSDEDYKNNTEIGTASLTIKGIGNVYKGTKTVTFAITGEVLKDGFIKNFESKKDYDEGNPVVQDKVKLVLNDRDKTELKGIERSEYESKTSEEKRSYDYVTEYRDNVYPGKATVTYTGVNGYSGTLTKTFTISGFQLSKAVIEKTSFKASLPYTGSPQKQDGVVLTYKKDRNGPDMLLKGADKSDYDEKDAQEKLTYHYVREYQKNTDAGTATLILTGVNEFTGTVKKNFKIDPYAIDPDKDAADQFTVSLPDDDNDATTPVRVTYTKRETAPVPVVKFGETVLTEGKDYKVSYVNNKVIADATDNKAPTVKITGKGNFKGTDQSCRFSIVGSDLETCGAIMTVADKAAESRSGKWVSVPVVTDANGKKLAEGTDYYKEIEYYRIVDGQEPELLDKSMTIAAGATIKAVVTGKGAYSGQIEGTYRIVAKDISKVNFSIKPKSYTGKAVKLENSDFTWKTDQLTLGTDFEIVEESYKNNIMKGGASVTVRGINEYGGTKTLKFTIGTRGIIWWFRNLMQ